MGGELMGVLLQRRREIMAYAEEPSPVGYSHKFVAESGDTSHFYALNDTQVEIVALQRNVAYNVDISPAITLATGDALNVSVTLVGGDNFSGRFDFGLNGAGVSGQTITQWSQLSHSKALASDKTISQLYIRKENTGNFTPTLPVVLNISISINGSRIL